MCYRFVEVDGSGAGEVIRSMNALCPETFPALSDDHLELGYWWLLKADPNILCGFAGMIEMAPFPGVGYLKRAYISPDHRGRGLQIRMIEAREEKARELGWHLLVSETSCFFSARNFERAGFERCEPEQPWAGDAMYFVKRLQRATMVEKSA